MYNDIKRLNAANAQLPSAVGVLYTAPVGKRAQIGTILLHNTGASSENVRLLDNGAVAENRFLNISLASNETYEFSPKVPFVLEGSEALQGLTTTAATVGVKIYGREEA